MVSARQMKIITLFLSLILSCSIYECVPMNYYTGKTLEDGESVVIAGLEYVDEQEYHNVAGPPLRVSLGYAKGFPYKFEFGIKYLFPLFVEGTMRYEITPRNNRIINMSLNSHLVTGYNIPPFLKYGITASREIGPVTPVLGYYEYGGFNSRGELTFDFIYSQSISFGLQIPVDGIYLIPEVNHQFSDDDISDGWAIYGIGLRFGLE